MEVVRDKEHAKPLVDARRLTRKAKPLVAPADAISAIRESKVMTEDQVNQLELCPTFQTQDYVIFLINDTSGNEPKLVLWAYAEKLSDNSGFLLSYGSGSANTVMKIRACAKLTLDPSLQNARFQVACELNDDGEEVTFKNDLQNEQFASSMTEIVNVEGGGRSRLAISSTEEHLHDVHDQPSHETSAAEVEEDFSDDGGGD